MANKYLTSESLTLIWAKIKNAFTPKHDGVEGVVANRYGVCDAAYGTVEKTATIAEGNFVLETGATVFIKFTNMNTAVNPTLNINNTGAKPIKRTDNTAVGTTANESWYGGTVVPLTYDGTNWIMHHSWDDNTQYVPASLGFGYAQCSTPEATLAKVVNIPSYKITTGGTATVKFQYAVPASSTLNISSKGAKNIFYHGAAITGGVIKAGDIATFIFDGTQYQLISLDRLEKDIGNLSTLETENKTSLVDAINEQSQQIDDLQGESDTRVLKPSAAFSIPASGGSVSYNLAGLTAGHELARWNFSSSAENEPPVDLSWYTYDGYFTITNTSGSTSETTQPVFVLPEVIATTVHS